MSISVETLALAKKYAEEVAGSGGGGANPDTIAEIVKQEFPGGVGYTESDTTVIAEWDTNTEGKESITVMGQAVYKVSSVVPTAEDLSDFELVLEDGRIVAGVAQDIGDLVQIWPNITSGEAYFMMYVAKTDGASYADVISFPEAGLWTAFAMPEGSVPEGYGDASPIVGIQKSSTTIHAIEDQYIPDTIARVSDITNAITSAIGGSY